MLRANDSFPTIVNNLRLFRISYYLLILQESGLDVEAIEEELRVGNEKYYALHSEELPKKETTKTQKAEGADEKIVVPTGKGLTTSTEDRNVGTISAGLYWRYFRSGLGAVLLILLVLLFLVAQGKTTQKKKNDHYPKLYLSIFLFGQTQFLGHTSTQYKKRTTSLYPS